MTRVLIIEDEMLIARDLNRIVENSGFQVVKICYNSDRALDALEMEDYDIILIDIHLKGSKDGIELAEIISQKFKKPFIFITSYADKKTIDRAKLTQPSGYIVKPFTQNDVFSNIEVAIHNYEKNNPEAKGIDSINYWLDKKLTEKEYKILKDISEGSTNVQMAHKYFISENTIRSHIKNIYAKLGTHNRAETVATLYQLMAKPR